jgi:hypothetical protein
LALSKVFSVTSIVRSVDRLLRAPGNFQRVQTCPSKVRSLEKYGFLTVGFHRHFRLRKIGEPSTEVDRLKRSGKSGFIVHVSMFRLRMQKGQDRFVSSEEPELAIPSQSVRLPVESVETAPCTELVADNRSSQSNAPFSCRKNHQRRKLGNASFGGDKRFKKRFLGQSQVSRFNFSKQSANSLTLSFPIRSIPSFISPASF